MDELADIAARLRKRGKKIVHCHGVFDLVHPGHIRHFQAAKKEGDVLIVTLTADRLVRKGPGRPVFNEQLRAEALSALEVVDYVSVIEKPTAVEAIKKLKSDVYVKGQDYKQARDDVTGKIVDEKKAVNAHGGRLHFTDDIVFSSSGIINNHLDTYPEHTREYLLRLKNKYDYGDIEKALYRPASLKIMVIGDAVVDQYDYCSPMGKSGKEPLVVSRYLKGESFAGGAVATANHAASLGGQVQLVSLLGRKESWRQFMAQNTAGRVKTKFFYRRGAVTTIKRRYVSDYRNQKLFEIYFMDDTALDRKSEADVSSYLRRHAGEYDLVIVNDFGHGFITDPLIKTICSGSKKLALNVQTNSANTGFNLVTKYPQADFVCVDEVELRYAAHDKESGLKKVVRKVQRQMNCELLVTTRGADGSLSWSRKRGFIETPAFAPNVVDAVGAGDAFFAFAAPVYAGGAPVELVSFVGNVAGSLATQIVGNREVVQLPDVFKFIQRLLK